MEQLKNLQKYYTDGFNLLNKGVAIYLITIPLALVYETFGPIFESANEGTKLLLSLVILLITPIIFAYHISTPVFFYSIKKTGRLDYSEVLTTTLKNAKRLILPLITITILLFAFLAIITIVTSSLRNLGIEETFREGSLALTQPLYSISLVLTFSFLITILIFTPILFSLYNKGVFASIKDGVLIAFRNPKFTLSIFIVTATTAILANMINQDYLAINLIKLLLGTYISLLIGATTLIYFIENKLDPSSLISGNHKKTED